MESHILECIVKVSERCNLDCSYCYYYHKNNQHWRELPAIMDPDTVKVLANFLARAATEHQLTAIKIDLHGGEPLLLRHERLDDFCNIIKDQLATVNIPISFSLQTNGTLINEAVIKLTSKHQIKLGISCDGPAIYHDQQRLDKRGRKTHHKLAQAFGLLAQAQNSQLIKAPGIICVINPSHDAAVILQYFIEEAKIKDLHFILPDQHHDDPPNFTSDTLDEYLQTLYQTWLEYNDPEIKIRLLEQIFYGLGCNLHNKSSDISCIDADKTVLTIQSNGQIFPDDSLRNLPTWQRLPDFNIASTSFAEILQNPLWRQLKFHQQHAIACLPCRHYDSCRGQTTYSRYSNRRGFNNVSIYCRSIHQLASHIARDYHRISNQPQHESTPQCA